MAFFIGFLIGCLTQLYFNWVGRLIEWLQGAETDKEPADWLEAYMDSHELLYGREELEEIEEAEE